MYESDYIMRMIQIMTRMIGETIFHKDMPAVNLFDEEDGLNSTGVLYHRLRKLVAAGEIEDAEQLLFDELERFPQLPYFQLAMQFYEDLNAMDETALKEGGFSKHEIELGIADACRLFGVDPSKLEPDQF